MMYHRDLFVYLEGEADELGFMPMCAPQPAAVVVKRCHGLQSIIGGLEALVDQFVGIEALLPAQLVHLSRRLGRPVLDHGFSSSGVVRLYSEAEAMAVEGYIGCMAQRAMRDGEEVGFAGGRTFYHRAGEPLEVPWEWMHQPFLELGVADDTHAFLSRWAHKHRSWWPSVDACSRVHPALAAHAERDEEQQRLWRARHRPLRY